jgi:Ca-activated chloride channel family protein
MMFSSVKLMRRAGSGRTVKHWIGKSLVALGVVMSLTAMARPQTTERLGFVPQQGIDIAMVLDVSGSMQSVDFSPNRLEVARKTVDDFISGRGGDRISLIIFAGTAYTRIPLTLDHDVLRESLAGITHASVNEDGTAIGMAISVGLNRLRKSTAASKVMILVTDGDNNAGAIDPVTASKLAQESGVKIYTIGIGSDTMILPVESFGRIQYRQFAGGFDEDLLRGIADITGGQYFRALDAKALEKVFDTIDQLERSEFEDEYFRIYHEWAFPFIQAALALLLAGIVLDRFYYVQIP